MMLRSSYQITRQTDQYIFIEDMNAPKSVTNDAEQVLYDLKDMLKGRRLFYRDSMGRVDEILYVTHCIFAGFKAGSDGMIDLGKNE